MIKKWRKCKIKDAKKMTNISSGWTIFFSFPRCLKCRCNEASSHVEKRNLRRRLLTIAHAQLQVFKIELLRNVDD